jgi:hypothetical protein
MGEVYFVKYEKVDGSDCYLLEIIPDIESMKELLDEQQMTAGTADWDELVSDMFKDLSYNVWVDKDTKQLKKMRMTMDIELNSADAGIVDADFEKMTMNMTVEMTMKDYNEPVSINLPAEAEDAIEM